MKQCKICGRVLTNQNQFTNKKTYKNHKTNRQIQLWTEVNISGGFEAMNYSDPIKPLCIKCAIVILENTIKSLEEM